MENIFLSRIPTHNLENFILFIHYLEMTVNKSRWLSHTKLGNDFHLFLFSIDEENGGF